MATLLAFLGVVVVLAVFSVVIIRKLGASKRVVLATRTNAVRADARAQAAVESADRITGVAQAAVQQVSDALDVAKEIHKVSEQMDLLIGHVGADQPVQPNRGRHSRPDLRAIRYAGDEESERLLA